MPVQLSNNPAVHDVVQATDEPHRSVLLQLRDIILSEAEAADLPGGFHETLKWGQPSYLPNRRGVGTTLRIAVHDEAHVGVYVHCQTSLIEQFRERFGDAVSYSGTRAVLLPVDQPIPEAIIRECTRLTLGYHRSTDG